MSSGNLYRYFPGKLDIAEEIGREAALQHLAAMREHAYKAAPRAADMLRAGLHTMLQSTYGQVRYDFRVHEMVMYLREERPEFWAWWSSAERGLIAEILAAGNASGEFQVADVGWTAELILAASFKFLRPQLYVDAPLEELGRELSGVLDLILRGLGIGSDTAAAGRNVAVLPDEPRSASSTIS
jgi:AcrR family transcriptional regulator